MYGETPVYTAASHGHLNVIKTLCNYGADVREGVVKNCLFSTLKELARSNQVKVEETQFQITIQQGGSYESDFQVSQTKHSSRLAK